MTDPKKWFEDLCKEAGLDEQQTATLVAVAGHEKAGPKIANLIKTALDDYPTEVGRVKALTPKAQTADRWEQWEKTEYPKLQAGWKQMQDKIAAYEAGGAPPEFDQTKFITKDDLEKYDADRAARFAGVLKDANAIVAEHVTRFSSVPDMDAIDRIAMENKIPLRMAYEKYVEPMRKEREAKENEDQKKKWREEIEADVRSRLHLPVDAVAPETAPIFSRTPKDQIPADIDQDLLATWHGRSK